MAGVTRTLTSSTLRRVVRSCGWQRVGKMLNGGARRFASLEEFRPFVGV